MKNTYLILIVLLGTSPYGIAQNPKFHYNGNEFRQGTNDYVSNSAKLETYLGMYFAVNGFNFHEQLCNNGVAYLKFKIGPKGISEIACTINAPENLREALKLAAQASGKYWLMEKEAEPTLVLLPIVYDFRKSGCQSHLQTKDSFSKKLHTFDDGTATFNETYLLLDPLVMISGPEDKF